MRYFKVIIDGDGEAYWNSHDELEDALIQFLTSCQADRKVELVYIGEEYEYE